MTQTKTSHRVTMVNILFLTSLLLLFELNSLQKYSGITPRLTGQDKSLQEDTVGDSHGDLRC